METVESLCSVSRDNNKLEAINALENNVPIYHENVNKYDFLRKCQMTSVQQESC